MDSLNISLKSCITQFTISLGRSNQFPSLIPLSNTISVLWSCLSGAQLEPNFSPNPVGSSSHDYQSHYDAVVIIISPSWPQW